MIVTDTIMLFVPLPKNSRHSHPLRRRDKGYAPVGINTENLETLVMITNEERKDNQSKKERKKKQY